MADPTQRAQADPVHPTRRWPMLLGLGVLVVIGHGLLLDAIYGLRQPKSLLSDMAVPMYTRVLSQTAAPEPEAAAPAAEDSVSTRPIASAAPTPRAKASTAARTKPRKRPASQAVASDEAEAQADAGTHDLPYDNSTEPDYAERQAAERQAEQRDALLASAAAAASSSTASSASAAGAGCAETRRPDSP